MNTAASPSTETPLKCFACDRLILGRAPHSADTRDGQVVHVGAICFRQIKKAGDAGYQPPKGGPRLYLIAEAD